MAFIFAAIGMIALASAVYGALTASAGGERDLTSRLMHLIAALLLAGAWSLGHRSGVGWAAMLVAAALEVGLGARSRAMERKLAQDLAQEQAGRDAEAIRATTVRERCASADGSDVSDSDRVTEAVASPQPPATTNLSPPPTSPPPFVTVVLLCEAHQVTGDVFVASVRRSGRRDARLISADASAGWQARIGDFAVLGTNERSPLDAAMLAEAAGQTFDWPEAMATCRDHAGHVRLVTRPPADASRAELVAVHRLAHAAIAEFAPVCGVLWEAARVLRPVAPQPRPDEWLRDQSRRDPPDDEPIPSAAARAAMEMCVNFRVTPIEPDESGTPRCVSDTVGLCAFGLPDIEIITLGEPNDRTSAVLYHLAEEFFTHGCNWPDGAEREVPPHGRWRGERRLATGPPSRPVMALNTLS